jgi:hypothetical protein
MRGNGERAIREKKATAPTRNPPNLKPSNAIPILSRITTDFLLCASIGDKHHPLREQFYYHDAKFL